MHKKEEYNPSSFGLPNLIQYELIVSVASRLIEKSKSFI